MSVARGRENVTWRQCPACGSICEGRWVGEYNEYKWIECSECMVRYVEPRLVMKDYYAKLPFYVEQTTRTNMPLSWYHRRFLRDLPMRGGKLLDVGCGCGAFLRVARREYEGYGIDFNDQLVRAAKDLYGLTTVYGESLKEHCGRGERFYDVVTCFEVLEHQDDPEGFLEMVETILAPNGLLVLSIPNGWVSGRVLEEGIDNPPHHFWRWKRESLGRFLGRLGWEIKTIEIRGLGNWQFTLERILVSAIPAIKREYRRAERSGTLTESVANATRSLFAGALAGLTYPLGLVAFPHGFVGIYAEARRWTKVPRVIT